jgi:DNA replicative helicase MCM subunit Mcm2 (Cdc46/Mcm family)
MSISAKACLRDFVLKEDAQDVIELMRASVNQIHMRDDGCLDRSRGGATGRSKRRPKAVLLEALRKTQQSKFSLSDIEAIAMRCGVSSLELRQIVDELRNEDPPKILKTGQFYTVV